MRKRFLSLALALVMALTLLPASALAAEQTAGDGTATPIILAFAASDAAQVGSTKEIKMTLTVTASKMWEPDKLQDAFTVKASVNGASDLDVTLSNGKAAGDKDKEPAVGASLSDDTTYSTTFDASFTMPNTMNSFTSKEVTLTITSRDESICVIESGGTLKVSLAEYNAPPVTGISVTITGFTAAVDPASPTAGEAVSFSIRQVDTFSEPIRSRSARTFPMFALEIKGVSWKQGEEVKSTSMTKAPDNSGTYNVEVSAALKEECKDEFQISSETLKYTIENVVVKAASTPPTPPKPPVPDTPKEEEKAPTINSNGVPVAGEVTTSKQADAAVSALKKVSLTTFESNLVTETGDETNFVASLAALESAVTVAKGIRVTVEPKESAVPSILRTHVPQITGAAFNASGASVSLIVDAPSRAYGFSEGYQLSMTLTGVTNSAKLDVPVILTLPLPSDVPAGDAVILHYHDDGSVDTIVPAVKDRTLRFVVTGFSDFVVTRQGSSAAGNAGRLARAGGSRNSASSLDALLPAIAALVNGDGVFVDVSATHWATKEIRWARDSGLMGGYENGNFRPWAPTARQELWMVLARLAGTRPADMAAAREWAMNAGVSDGTNPHGALSRQQLVTMLYRFAKSRGADVSASRSLGGFADSGKVASYAKEPLSWAAAKGIVGGDSKGNLNPEGAATRAHFAVFLYRYASK